MQNTDDPEKISELEQRFKSLLNKKAERIAHIRRHFKIKVDGDRVPPPLDSFDKIQQFLKLDVSIMKRIREQIKFRRPTPIQMQTIPIITKKRDVIALAETGSGKSLSFILPILCKVNPEVEGVEALILAPTRELLLQLYNQFLVFNPHPKKIKVKFLRKKLIPKDQTEVKDFVKNVKILLSTPLRLEKVLRELDLQFSSVKHLVVDEADALFDMGFLGQVDKIIKHCTNPALQKSFFSATMQPAIEDLLKENMSDPIRITVGIKNATTSNVTQKLVYCGGEEGKIYAMRNIFRDGFTPPMLVFVQNKQRGMDLYHELIYEGISVNVIHGDRIKEQRDEIVKKFRTGKISVLICTDLMSRGIDFLTVNYVVNYDFPQSIVSYIHRVGRTGRAGNQGTAITLFTDADIEYLRSIANLMKKSGCDVQPWMLELKNPGRKKWKELEKNPKRRQTISTSIKKNTDRGFKKVINNFSKRIKKKHMKSQEENADPTMKEIEDISDEDERAQYLDELQNPQKEIPEYNEDDDEGVSDVEEYDELSE